MKRLALLLGSLLVVSAAASAKEVVPAPVVVEEAPVQIVEKEVIVYKDKEEGFRPNGYVDLQYRWYGDTEGQNEDNKPNWNGANNYSRIQLQGMLNMTEKQALEYRVRAYNELDKENSIDDNRHSKTNTETRLRYFYDHGLVGDSKVNLTSRVHYNDGDGTQEVEYQARFDFADYLFNNDFIQTTSFILAPKYMYKWNDNNSSDYENTVGVDLYSTYDLPWGFSMEFNLYTFQHFYGQDKYFDGGEKLEDQNFTVDVEWYLYNTTNLYTNGKYSVDFVFEGGLESYGTYDRYASAGTPVDKTNGRRPEYTADSTKWVGDDHSSYQLYATPAVQVSYQATDFTTIYAAAGAEYRNWEYTNARSASHWRWQPTVWAGFKTTF